MSTLLEIPVVADVLLSVLHHFVCTINMCDLYILYIYHSLWNILHEHFINKIHQTRKSYYQMLIYVAFIKSKRNFTFLFHFWSILGFEMSFIMRSEWLIIFLKILVSCRLKKAKTLALKYFPNIKDFLSRQMKMEVTDF